MQLKKRTLVHVATEENKNQTGLKFLKIKIKPVCNFHTELLRRDEVALNTSFKPEKPVQRTARSKSSLWVLLWCNKTLHQPS